MEDGFFSTFKKQVQDAINDLKTKDRRYRQIPNLLTLLRLTAPCFIIPAAAFGNVPLILGLTAFFSLTDLADGFIARKYNLTSELGETLDAVTDKVFASTLLATASFTNPLLLVNLALEGIIAGINAYKKINNEPVKSSTTGKLKTWFLFSLIGIGIASPYFELNSILNVLMASTLAMQVFTINSYLPFDSADEELNPKKQDKNTKSNISNMNPVIQKDLQKDKVLETNSSVSSVQNDENESIVQLKEMRELLMSEKTFLELEEKISPASTNRCKNKVNDLKKISDYNFKSE